MLARNHRNLFYVPKHLITKDLCYWLLLKVQSLPPIDEMSYSRNGTISASQAYASIVSGIYFLEEGADTDRVNTLKQWLREGRQSIQEHDVAAFAGIKNAFEDDNVLKFILEHGGHGYVIQPDQSYERSLRIVSIHPQSISLVPDQHKIKLVDDNSYLIKYLDSASPLVPGSVNHTIYETVIRKDPLLIDTLDSKPSADLIKACVEALFDRTGVDDPICVLLDEMQRQALTVNDIPLRLNEALTEHLSQLPLEAPLERIEDVFKEEMVADVAAPLSIENPFDAFQASDDPIEAKRHEYEVIRARAFAQRCDPALVAAHCQTVSHWKLFKEMFGARIAIQFFPEGKLSFLADDLDL